MPNTNTIIDKIIPGFSSVSVEAQRAFYDSTEGASLSTHIQFGHFNTPTSGYVTAASVLLNRNTAQERIETFRQTIQNSVSFSILRREINQTLLQTFFFDYLLLDDETQKQIAESECSKKLHERLTRHPITQASLDEPLLETVRTRQEEIVTRFLNRLDAHVTFLIQQPLNEKETFDLAQQMYGNETVENKKESLRQYFYSTDQRLSWMETQPSSYAFLLQDALSWLTHNLISQNISENMIEFKKYMDGIADAHTFYQFLGLATENGGWELDCLDLYNYARNQRTIGELKTITSALMQPLHAFFHEYAQIAKYEKNRAYIILRALAPILVMGVFIVCAFSLVAPFAIHALLELFMLIPVLYLGVAAASLYVECKNQAYTAIYAYYWNGIYNTPPFQVSPRMLRSFNEENQPNHPLCDLITTFYTDKLKVCDQIERAFAREATGTLTTDEWVERKKNIQRKSSLLLEWYDIQANPTLGSEKSRAIVSKRLREEGHFEYLELQTHRNRYVEQLLTELGGYRISPTSNAANIRNRALFFSPSQPVQALRSECARHQEKIRTAESIYIAMEDGNRLDRI